MSAILVALLLAVTPEPAQVVEQSVQDYVVGQYEADPARVSRVLHPDLAKRGLLGSGADAREVFPLRRMTSDELIDITRRGELRTAPAEQVLKIQILDLTARTAIVRVDTPYFTDHLQLALFGDRWLIVNALWAPPQ
ncbi:putative lumazine-binding protein [compost metagenome]